MPADTDIRQPALFVSHGSPLVALDDDAYTQALSAWSAARPVPAAIVVVSAHWEEGLPVRATASERPALIYDFGGFPPKLYQLLYPCPGAPALAEELVERLRGADVPAQIEPARGLDHGVWVPLHILYRKASIPVVELSLPTGPGAPARLGEIGRALAPLRERGVLLMGSGGTVHNLRRLNWVQKYGPVDAWAAEFDRWVRERVGALDAAGLARYRTEAPQAALAMPTSEHFDPLFFTIGAALPGDRVVDVFEGFQHGNLSMRCFALEG